MVVKRVRLNPDQGSEGHPKAAAAIVIAKETQALSHHDHRALQRSPEKRQEKAKDLLRRSSSCDSEYELSPSFLQDLSSTSNPASSSSPDQPPAVPPVSLHRARSFPGNSLERIPETFEESEDMLHPTTTHAAFSTPAPTSKAPQPVTKREPSSGSLTIGEHDAPSPQSLPRAQPSPPSVQQNAESKSASRKSSPSTSPATAAAPQPKEKSSSPKTAPVLVNLVVEVRKSLFRL